MGEYLERQKARDTIVGDIAKDVMSDKNFPVAATTYAEVLSYMENVSASDAAIIALKAAWTKFNASVKRAGNQAISKT